MEDLDQSRCRPKFAQQIVDDLLWLGLDWDGPIVSQWQRLVHLQAAANDLLLRGRAYPCVCTRIDLEQALRAPHGEEAGTGYSGTCRGVYQSVEHARATTGRAAALRLLVPKGEWGFVDGIAGPQFTNVGREVGDFVIANRAQVPSYQLAVVVDDLFQGVTEVFRGNDLLSSTARQAQVYEALGAVIPNYFHAPLVVDESGVRLAKRRDDLSLGSLRAQGVSPESIVSWVVKSTGLRSADCRSARQWLTEFALHDLTRAAIEAPTSEQLASNVPL